MTPEERQALLDEHGLIEDERGFGLTLRGIQQASRRALRLRERGHGEATQMLRLLPHDPLRLGFLLALQSEAFFIDLSKDS